ncbi:MAG: hypothetical protein ABI790_11355 [Betaproteobacteria bacterium]
MGETNDNQDRTPPAYQEYAAFILAAMAYRLMCLAERGLTWSMKLECWHNSSVPADPALLARLLGYTRAEIDAALTPNVMFFFRVDGDRIICPELDAYKARLNDRRERQSAGGKASAAKINRDRKSAEKRASSGAESKQTAKPQVSSKPPVRWADSFSAQHNPAQHSPNQLTKGGVDAFVSAMEKAESNADSSRAPRKL